MGTVDLVSDFDVENTIFVAVGKNVDKSKTTLFWALQSFSGKRICLLHVYQPANAFPLIDKKYSAGKPKQEMLGAFQELQKMKRLDVLNQYCRILAQQGVQAGKVWIQMESVEKGIVEIIAQYNIRWLVMGAAADKYYSKKLTGLKSKKAVFVSQYAPISCHIWFSCKGCLIYTREGRIDRSEKEIALPSLQQNSGIETQESGDPRLESCTQTHSLLADLEEISRSLDVQCSVNSSQMIEQEEINQEQTIERTTYQLERKIVNITDSEKNPENDDMEAKCKAKALKNLCVKEISLRKEMEEELSRKKQEVEKTRNQLDELNKELSIIQQQISVLESQLTESDSTVKDLEDKIISAVELLISFKSRRDEARVEYENALKEAKKLRRLGKMKVEGIFGSEILEFSFMEINQATHEIDPLWKIGDGKYGSVYKGILRHVHVAIKMLPSDGSQSQILFRRGVEILSRVRHPNLVTLIGICPELRSLVYEYVQNGSLEDRLACKNKKPPLSWHARVRIASEICSALIFLHSNSPSMIHGNLKLSKVILDANYVSKLSDFGISNLVPNGEKSKNTSLYSDPEYIKTGKLTPESDIYSFGVIILQLLTARPVSGLVENVKCALENNNLQELLDFSAGKWLVEQAEVLAKLALRCCESNPLQRPDLVSSIWGVLEPLRALCVDSESCFVSKELHKIPSHFVCPIFQEVMKDPYIAADGFTYDADAIKGWLKSGKNTSPMTNLKLEHCNLVPNHALYQAIQDWKSGC